MYTLVLKHCSWMGTPGTYVYVGTYGSHTTWSFLVEEMLMLMQYCNVLCTG